MVPFQQLAKGQTGEKRTPEDQRELFLANIRTVRTPVTAATKRVQRVCRLAAKTRVESLGMRKPANFLTDPWENKGRGLPF
ncbi:hypothetical protein Pyn_40618 [Prunus yedoensis var. nudiflora]|uniref:Uncharacterized protein n=1 Tax=Prunus yedoensis var. nudiflora TaxID=2094558 RepID=A0A314Y8Y0_PRUYE|nr:hypothetical protein Pyn_40618 [Prunus yedoensis var. nudiflora]